MRNIVTRAALLVAFSVVAASCALPGNVTGSREISAMFDDVGDLVTGHSVQVADVRIGSVTDIELTDDYRARVTMSIKDDVFVPRESRALLRTTSLLGEKFIELRPIDEDDPLAGTDLVDGDTIDESTEAPELEFVTERAVEILGSVVASDVATLVETGSIGFAERGPELRSLVEDLSTISGTLADQTDELVRIIDALDGATATLAEGATDIDSLLTAAIGESCQPREFERFCQSGASCAATSLDGTSLAFECVERVGAGEACYLAFPSMCPEGRYCTAQPGPTGELMGTCEPLPTVGMPCVQASGTALECAPGLDCQAIEGTRTCVQLQANGGACSSPTDCASSFCDDGVCAAPELCAG